MPVGFLAFSIRSVLPVQRVWIILPNQLSKSMPGDLRVAPASSVTYRQRIPSFFSEKLHESREAYS